jgi:hypothetical protein
VSLLKRFFGAFAKSAPTIVAMSSMFIAALSLYHTVDAQRRDLEYKEISIQPRPSLLPVFADMSLSIKNLGLGPAVIQQIDFEQDGQCVSSAGKDASEWQKIYAAFLNATAVTVYSRSLSLVPKTPGDKKKFDFELDALQVNDTIRAGEDRYLFRLAPGTLKLFRGADTSVQVAAADKFSQNAYTVPIIIHACSATGRTCMFVGEAAACTSMPATGPGAASSVAPPEFAPG